MYWSVYCYISSIEDITSTKSSPTKNKYLTAINTIHLLKFLKPIIEWKHLLRGCWSAKCIKRDLTLALQPNSTHLESENEVVGWNLAWYVTFRQDSIQTLSKTSLLICIPLASAILLYMIWLLPFYNAMAELNGL